MKKELRQPEQMLNSEPQPIVSTCAPAIGNNNVVGSTVYLMDCVEGMKHYPDKYFDLAVVDPPYGIGMSEWKTESNGKGSKQKGFTKGGRNLHTKKDWDLSIPGMEYFTELYRVSKEQIIWGANYFTQYIPPSMGWIYWHKKGTDATNFSDGELAYTSFNKSLKWFKYDWLGFGYINNAGNDKKIHHTQKPVALYDFCFQFAKCVQGMKILDTHIGSQSSRIAADKAGLDITGYEIDKEYYDLGEKRFKQYKSQLRIEGW